MAQRWRRIFGGLAGLSSVFCAFAVYILNIAYSRRGRIGWIGGQLAYIWSKGYRYPPEMRAEAWLAVIVTALLPMAWITLQCASAYRKVRSRKWAARGLCPGCGYDTRMTPDRCPECGASHS